MSLTMTACRKNNRTRKQIMEHKKHLVQVYKNLCPKLDCSLFVLVDDIREYGLQSGSGFFVNSQKDLRRVLELLTETEVKKLVDAIKQNRCIQIYKKCGKRKIFVDFRTKSCL